MIENLNKVKRRTSQVMNHPFQLSQHANTVDTNIRPLLQLPA